LDVEEEASGSNAIGAVSHAKRSVPRYSQQQRTVLQLIQGTPWMASWLCNPNSTGSNQDAYDGAQDGPPAGLS